MARTLFSRVLWTFYLPWPWSIYFMITSLFREITISIAFKSLFLSQFEKTVSTVLFCSDCFSVALIYATGNIHKYYFYHLLVISITEYLHRNEFQQYKNHLKSSQFIEQNMPIYLNALEVSFSTVIGTDHILS